LAVCRGIVGEIDSICQQAAPPGTERGWALCDLDGSSSSSTIPESLREAFSETSDQFLKDVRALVSSPEERDWESVLGKVHPAAGPHAALQGMVLDALESELRRELTSTGLSPRKIKVFSVALKRACEGQSDPSAKAKLVILYVSINVNPDPVAWDAILGFYAGAENDLGRAGNALL